MSSGALGGWDVTVIVCVDTHMRWNDICDAIKSVVRQSVPPIECLVVVDHDRSLADELTAFVWRCGFEAVVSVVPSTGPRGLSGARNSGVARATTPVVAFLDGDSVADRKWLSGLLAAYDSPDVRGVGGHVRPQWPGRVRPGWFPSEFNWVVDCSYDGLPATTSEVRNLLGANMSVRRDDAIASKGFHIGSPDHAVRHRVCGETELCLRILDQTPRARMMYAPDAAVGHRVGVEELTLRHFLRRCHAEGRSKAAVSTLAGNGVGFSGSRQYALRVLPRGIVGRLAGIMGTDAGVRERMDCAAQTTVLTGGVVAATVGYVQGKVTGAGVTQRLTPLHLHAVDDRPRDTRAAAKEAK